MTFLVRRAKWNNLVLNEQRFKGIKLMEQLNEGKQGQLREPLDLKYFSLEGKSISWRSCN